MSRSRQSEKQPIIDELALIEHAHMGRSFRARRTVQCVKDKVITIEQAYAVTTIQAKTRERLALTTSNFKMSLKSLTFTESYYFHVYVVSCDVHFRYSHDAIMWTV